MKNRILLLFSLLFLLAGCSGLINQAHLRATTEETLLKAGFKPVPIAEEQEVSLEGFPAGKISSLQRHGTLYYIYPDFKHDRLLIGTQSALARYHELVTHQLAPLNSSNLEHDWTSSGVWKN